MNRRGCAALLLLIPLSLTGCGEEPKALRDRAVREWSAKRLDGAEDALARLAKLRPLDPGERLLRAQVARERGRIDEAIDALEGPAAESSSPVSRAELAAARGTLELARSHFAAAEEDLARALKLDPRRAEARRELINLYALQGRAAELDARLAEAGRADDTMEFARSPDHHRRPGREPGGDQGARHQWWRLLQRQLRAPVREPQPLHQLVRDLLPAADPVQPAAHLRQAGQGQPAGLRHRRHHGGDLDRQHRRHHGVRAGPPRCGSDGGRCRHGGQGGPQRRTGQRPVRQLDDADLDRRGRLVPRQLHPARRRAHPRRHDDR